MKRTFHTDRKAMVKAVSEALGIPSKYLGAPTRGSDDELPDRQHQH